MEVEAKRSISDARTFAAWQARTALAAFTLARPRSVFVEDEYLDSAERACITAGYACRVRLAGGKATATLKALGDAQPGAADGVRRREELEVELSPPPEAAVATANTAAGDEAPAWQQPAAWPAGEARVLALRLLGDRPLRRLTTIRQQRHERDVCDGSRLVATLSLDDVRFADGRPPLFELEVELAPNGTEADLATIVAALRAEPGFEAQTRSKLQLALHGVAASATLALLLARYDDPQAQRLVALAAALFDATASLHALSAARRSLLGFAARLGAAGRAVQPERSWAAAADLLAAAPAPGVSAAEYALAYAALRLLALPVPTGKVRGKAAARWLAVARQEPALVALDAADAREALALAARLGAAEALAEAGAADASALVVTLVERRTTLTLRGAEAERGAAGVDRAAAIRWHAAFGVRLRLRRLPAEARGAPLGLRYDAPLAQVGRVALRSQFARLLPLCDELHRDCTEDAVHDARVLGRRMRTLLRLLRRAYPRRAVEPVERGLQRLGGALGAVRDLDVLLGAAQAEAAEPTAPGGLSDLIADWEQRRAVARRRLVAHLESAAFAAWQERCAAFLTGESATERGRARLCDCAPALIWRRYQDVRAAVPDVTAASLTDLHAARRALRRLRYLLDALRELLGKGGAAVIADLIAVQDALGALQDANVLRDLLLARLADRAAGGQDEPAALTYLERTLAQISERRRAAEQAWPRVTDRRFRRRLGRVVAAL